MHAIMGLMQRQFNSAISAGMAGYQQWSAWSALSNTPGVNGQSFHIAQIGKVENRANSNTNNSQEYKPGQAAADDAKAWLANTHSELHPNDYRVLDARLLGDKLGSAFWPGKVLVDTRKLDSEYRVVETVAHELLHKQDGYIRSLFLTHKQHVELTLKAFWIGQEYLNNSTGQ